MATKPTCLNTILHFNNHEYRKTLPSLPEIFRTSKHEKGRDKRCNYERDEAEVYVELPKLGFEPIFQVPTYQKAKRKDEMLLEASSIKTTDNPNC